MWPDSYVYGVNARSDRRLDHIWVTGRGLVERLLLFHISCQIPGLGMMLKPTAMIVIVLLVIAEQSLKRIASAIRGHRERHRENIIDGGCVDCGVNGGHSGRHHRHL